MPINYRKGTLEDSFAVFKVFLKSIMDYSERMNVDAITGGKDPEKLGSLWATRESMFEFLAQSASQFWVAEKNGEIVGYARSVEHDGVQELTEYFVNPDQQSAGIGGELLARAFPKSDAKYRTIIATLDQRALYQYMKMGVYGRFLFKYFLRKAEKVDVKTDLKIERLNLDVHLEQLNQIDKEIIGHAHPDMHQWLVKERDGYVYKREDKLVGYGYIGASHGPFALSDENDFPAVLAHGESLMAEIGEDFGASVPLINTKAIGYFIEHKYEIDSFSAILMSNLPFGKFENYLTFTPEFFL